MARAEHTEVVPAAPDAVFDALAAIDTYPSWQKAVKAVDVRTRDVDGRPHEVQFRTDAKVKEVRYVLRYHYDRPSRIWFDYVEGDAKTVAGGFTLAPAGDGATRVTYQLDVDAGGAFVPGKVKQALAEQAVQSTLRALRGRVGGA